VIQRVSGRCLRCVGTSRHLFRSRADCFAQNILISHDFPALAQCLLLQWLQRNQTAPEVLESHAGGNRTGMSRTDNDDWIKEIVMKLRHALAATALLGASGIALAQAPSFVEADTNGDGVISREEAAAVPGLDFDSADTDGDGVLSRDEYKAAVEDEYDS